MKIFERFEIEHTSDFERILSLPRRTWTDAELEKLARELTSVLRVPGGTMSLRPLQALGLYDLYHQKGLVGFIRVGGGKTLLSLLAPYVIGAKRPVLVLPAALVGKTERERQALVQQWRGMQSVYLQSYEFLGVERGSTWLSTYKPDMLVLDEAHRCKHMSAGRTRRVYRYLRDNPDVVVVVLSGTFMKHGLADYAHLVRWALKDKAPVPMLDGEVKEWCDALDSDVNPLKRRGVGALVGLCTADDFLGRERVEAVRLGFRRRLLETPGVVASVASSDDVDCSLYIDGHVHDLPSSMDNMFQSLRADMLTPDGRDLFGATEVYAHARQMALGFHYVQVSKKEWLAWRSRIKTNNSSIKENGEERISKEQEKRREGLTESIQTHGKPLNKRNTGVNTGDFVTTDSRNRPFNCSSRSMKEDVTAADANYRSKSETGVSTSTIATKQDELEDCCAHGVMWESANSVTVLKGSEPLYAILNQCRPPEPWRNARKAWAKFVRETLASTERYDTEKQVRNACVRQELPDHAWTPWRDAQDICETLTLAVWHDDTALKLCEAWMSKGPGIVWADSVVFGEELARRTGAPYYRQDGKTAKGEFIEDADCTKAIIASQKSNKEGRNLQGRDLPDGERWPGFARNLITSCPPGADELEQTIGRTHRAGQEADEVIVDVLLLCREHADSWLRAVEAAQATEDMLGQPQKILLADVTGFLSAAELKAKRGAQWNAEPAKEFRLPTLEELLGRRIT